MRHSAALRGIGAGSEGVHSARLPSRRDQDRDRRDSGRASAGGVPARLPELDGAAGDRSGTRGAGVGSEGARDHPNRTMRHSAALRGNPRHSAALGGTGSGSEGVHSAAPVQGRRRTRRSAAQARVARACTRRVAQAALLKATWECDSGVRLRKATQGVRLRLRHAAREFAEAGVWALAERTPPPVAARQTDRVGMYGPGGRHDAT